jgi:hypothetical protein
LNKELDAAARDHEEMKVSKEGGSNNNNSTRDEKENTNSSPTNAIHHLADIASSQPATPLKGQITGQTAADADPNNMTSTTSSTVNNNMMMTTFISPLRRLITPRSDVIRPQTLVKLPPMSELAADKVLMYDGMNYASRDPLFADAERILQAAQTASTLQ